MDSTVAILEFPFSPCAFVAVTAPFNISGVTDTFWFTSICVPVTSYSELNSFTVTFTSTVSFEPSL